jgi:hypothetical protein
MLNAQAAAISAALVAAGINPDAAARIAKILGNPDQALYHNGPQKVDVTPRAMRRITPDVRKHQLPNVDFPEGDPDYREPVIQVTEEIRVPQPAAAVRQPEIPAQRDKATFRVASGRYVSATSTGDTVKVGLRTAGAGRAVFFDSPANTLVGKTLRAENDASDNGRLRFYIDETGQEVVWRLQLQNVEDYEVVTGVEFKEGRGLEVTYSTVQLWKGGEPETELIPTSRQQVIEDIDEVTDNDGNKKTIVQRAVFDAFGADAADGFELPTTAVKLCRTGESGWEKDTTANLSVFDSDGSGGEAATGEVIEQCRNRIEYVPPNRYVIVAKTPGGQWHLIARQREWCMLVPPGNLPGLDGAELASNGYSVSHTAGDVEVGAEGNPTALLLEQGCARWVTTQLVQVVTGVTIDAGQLLVTYSPSYVLKSLTPTEPVSIPLGIDSVLTGVTLTSSGLEFTKKQITTLASAPDSGATIPTESCGS